MASRPAVKLLAWRWGPMVAWMAVIFWASGLSIRLPTPGMIDVPWDAKFQHTVAYAILAGLLATVWQLSSGVLTARHLSWTWIAVVIYGALDEITQIPVSRDCDFWDWTADATGAAVGLLAFVWLRRRYTARAADTQ